jgi:anaerobic magnesium-protoporphyrin IX monomethyl ester cyclase
MTTKAKVVLVRPEYSFAIYQATYRNKFSPGGKQVSTPMQLMQLGAEVVKAGHDVRIIDAEAENLSRITELVDRIAAERPDVVGVTCTSPEYHRAKGLLEAIKRRIPHVVTVIGGAHATHVPWELATEIEGVDYVVIYEGEKALVAVADGDTERLAEYAENARALMKRVGAHPPIGGGKPLLGPNQTVEDLEQLQPLRGRPYLDMTWYRYSDPGYGLVITDSIETARGCPFSCTFCSSARSGLGMRRVETVLDELEVVQSRFRRAGGTGLVLFLDDTLTFSRQRATELFEGMLRRGFRMHCAGFTRANTIHTRFGRHGDREFASLMKRAGFRNISFGVETGSEKINEQMKKGVSLDDYRQACSLLRRVGFDEIRGSFIIGNPYETVESIWQSINFAKELRLDRIGVNIMTPYPGTAAYESARLGKGLYFEPGATSYQNYRRWGNAVVSTEELTAEALIWWHGRFLAEVYGSFGSLRHSWRNIRSGNYSGFYHRPVVDALKRRVKMWWNGQWATAPDFGRPDHSNYDSSFWGVAHIHKTDCLKFLGERYGTGLQRKPIGIPSARNPNTQRRQLQNSGA